jgi:hypothetical protein
MTKLNRLTICQFFREAHMERRKVIPFNLMRKLLPAKDAFSPGLKRYSYQKTKLLHLKVSIDVKKNSIVDR